MPNQVKSDLIFNERLTDFSVDICNRVAYTNGKQDMIDTILNDQ